EVAGDLAFASPIGFMRAGTLALGLLPDLELLARERRLPQALELEAEASELVHGLFATRAVDDGRGRTLRDPELAVTVRGERLTFAHELRVTATAEPRRTRFLWQQRCWRTSNAVEHLDRALTVPVDAALEQALERGWQHFPRVHSTAGFVVAGQRDGEEHALWTRDRNLVDLAVALARTA